MTNEKNDVKYFIVLIEEGPDYDRREKELPIIGDWEKVLNIVKKHRKPILLYAEPVTKEKYYKVLANKP